MALSTQKMESAYGRDYDRWIILVGLFFFVASTSLIFNERLSFKLFQPVPVNLEVGAKVNQPLHDVRHRIAEDLVWRDLFDNDDAYIGDSVFSGKDSTANLQLASGSRLTLDPESLIILGKDLGRVSVALQFGSFSGTLIKGQAFTTKIGDRVLQLTGDGTEFRLDGNLGESSGIGVLKGSLNIFGLGATQTVNQNERIKIKKDGVDLEKFPITLVSPTEGATLWTQENDIVAFKWSGLKSAKGYQFKLATDREFKHLVYEGQSADQEALINLAALLRSGVFYWKVESETISSFSRKFVLFHDDAPKLLLPLDRERLVFGPGLGRKPASLSQKVTFEWGAQSNANYEYQFAKDAEFENILIDKKTRYNTLVIPATEAGLFYWRVRVNDRLRPHSPWSEVRSFSMLTTEELLKAPEISNRHLIFEMPE